MNTSRMERKTRSYRESKKRSRKYRLDCWISALTSQPQELQSQPGRSLTQSSETTTPRLLKKVSMNGTRCFPLLPISFFLVEVWLPLNSMSLELCAEELRETWFLFSKPMTSTKMFTSTSTEWVTSSSKLAVSALKWKVNQRQSTRKPNRRNKSDVD